MSQEEKYTVLVQALQNKAAEILPKGSQVALYGSRARGDAYEDSDCNLHVLYYCQNNYRPYRPYRAYII